MNAKELDEWGADFLQFCARFADVFRSQRAASPSHQVPERADGVGAAQEQLASSRSDRRPHPRCHAAIAVPGEVECGHRPGSAAAIRD